MPYGSLFSTKLVSEGRFEEAIDAAEREIALDPGEPEAIFNRAQARAALGRYADAVADYERALRMDMSGSILDEETVDDELFHALRTWATEQRADPAAAAATLSRYAALLPSGRHRADVAKWVDSFNGMERVWIRERV